MDLGLGTLLPGIDRAPFLLFFVFIASDTGLTPRAELRDTVQTQSLLESQVEPGGHHQSPVTLLLDIQGVCAPYGSCEAHTHKHTHTHMRTHTVPLEVLP